MVDREVKTAAGGTLAMTSGHVTRDVLHFSASRKTFRMSSPQKQHATCSTAHLQRKTDDLTWAIMIDVTPKPFAKAF